MRNGLAIKEYLWSESLCQLAIANNLLRRVGPQINNADEFSLEASAIEVVHILPLHGPTSIRSRESTIYDMCAAKIDRFISKQNRAIEMRNPAPHHRLVVKTHPLEFSASGFVHPKSGPKSDYRKRPSAAFTKKGIPGNAHVPSSDSHPETGINRKRQADAWARSSSLVLSSGNQGQCPGSVKIKASQTGGGSSATGQAVTISSRRHPVAVDSKRLKFGGGGGSRTPVRKSPKWKAYVRSPVLLIRSALRNRQKSRHT